MTRLLRCWVDYGLCLFHGGPEPQLHCGCYADMMSKLTPCELRVAGEDDMEHDGHAMDPGQRLLVGSMRAHEEQAEHAKREVRRHKREVTSSHQYKAIHTDNTRNTNTNT